MTLNPDLIDPTPGKALPALVEAVNGVLDQALSRIHTHLATVDPALAPLTAISRAVVDAGGKRFRPAFVWWGHRASGSAPDPAVLTIAAAVELLHTFALVHDDIMDRASARRNVPTSHIQFHDLHDANGWLGDGEWFGISSGIIHGDLISVWADQVFWQADVDRDLLVAAYEVYNIMRAEVMAGQWLDIRLAALPDAQVAESRHVALLKSGRYSITRPLQLGATLGGLDDPTTRHALATYGDEMGVAFQMRDDVLGIFGDQAKIGKSVASDIREGKRTVLMLTALARADAAQRAVLDASLGNVDLDGDGIAWVRTIVEETGAVASIEDQIQAGYQRALDALTVVAQPAQRVLAELADMAINRSI